MTSDYGVKEPWNGIAFSGGNSPSPTTPTPPPPPFALEKSVLALFLVKISENSSIFREGVGGGGRGGAGRSPPRPTEISATDCFHSRLSRQMI
jgi:hypothetical protein